MGTKKKNHNEKQIKVGQESRSLYNEWVIKDQWKMIQHIFTLDLSWQKIKTPTQLIVTYVGAILFDLLPSVNSFAEFESIPQDDDKVSLCLAIHAHLTMSSSPAQTEIKRPDPKIVRSASDPRPYFCTHFCASIGSA